MKMRTTLMTALVVALLVLPACAGGTVNESSGEVPPTATVTEVPVTEIAPTAPAVVATRVGADYVLRLPREAAVPADWAMSPSPDFSVRRPQPGDTYHFACLDLTARSVGVASVGYRSLEGLPNVHIEYVIYPTDEDATAALDDMARAARTCTEFTIGEGDGAIAAGFAPLEFPSYGDASFAAALSTDSPLMGRLLTHMIKIRSGHVVIGINHANYAGEPLPDVALTESLAALAVGNLRDGPLAPGQ